MQHCDNHNNNDYNININFGGKATCSSPTLPRHVKRREEATSLCSTSGEDFCRVSSGWPRRLQNENVLPERKWKNAFRFLAGSLCDTLRQSHTKETWEVKQVTG